MKPKNNPFSLNFGKEPYRLISRNSQIEEITDTFESDTPSSNLFIITGVRGPARWIKREDAGWIIVLALTLDEC